MSSIVALGEVRHSTLVFLVLRVLFKEVMLYFTIIRHGESGGMQSYQYIKRRKKTRHKLRESNLCHNYEDSY